MTLCRFFDVSLHSSGYRESLKLTYPPRSLKNTLSNEKKKRRRRVQIDPFSTANPSNNTFFTGKRMQVVPPAAASTRNARCTLIFHESGNEFPRKNLFFFFFFVRLLCSTGQRVPHTTLKLQVGIPCSRFIFCSGQSLDSQPLSTVGFIVILFHTIQNRGRGFASASEFIR